MRISDTLRQQMRVDREEGMTLTQLMLKYGKARSTTSLIIRGCDESKVRRAAPGRRIVQSVETKDRPILSTTDIGEAARQMICARLMWNGVKVFRPMTEDTPVDLLVLKGDGKVVKCQCKYMYPMKKGSHLLKCSTNGRGGDRGSICHKYTEEEVDLFLGYCQDNDSIYVLPFKDKGERTEVTFWISRKCCGGNGMKSFQENDWKNRFDLLK